MKETGKIPAWSKLLCTRGTGNICTTLLDAPVIKAVQTVFLILEDFSIKRMVCGDPEGLEMIDPDSR